MKGCGEMINDEVVMREVSKIALEKVFQTCAEKARWAASVCPSDMSGRDALLAFADTIVSTNTKTFPAQNE